MLGSNTSHRIERARGESSRSFSLPSWVDCRKDPTSLYGGLLTVSVQTSEAAQPRKIEVM